MLKLEKIAKTLEVSISMRQRESVFSTPLLKAFGIAIALHLAAGILFQVSPFRIIGSQTIFPPVLVDAELAADADNSVIAQVDAEEISPRRIKEPRRSSLGLPELLANLAPEHPPLASGHPTVCAIRCAVKDRELSPLDLLSMERILPKKKPIDIVISGDLADRTMVSSEFPLSSQESLTGPIRIVYSVQVEDRTGLVFWYETQTPDAPPSVATAADKILRGLRFQTQTEAFVTSGEIEIHFNSETAAG